MITNEKSLFLGLETIIQNLEVKQARKQEIFSRGDLDLAAKIRSLEQEGLSVIEEKNVWLDQQLQLIKKMSVKLPRSEHDEYESYISSNDSTTKTINNK